MISKSNVIVLAFVSVLLIALAVLPPLGSAADVSSSQSKVIYAGVRSSSYGIKPFPDPEAWRIAMTHMKGLFPGSAPCAIWIVGEFRGPRDCQLYFPSEGKSYPHIRFHETDKHERYLTYFDKTGIKVYLQVEPAHADIPVLIDLVLNRYKHHECVIGFGVDVEWYREADHPEWGAKVDDATAKEWEARVKSHNGNYQMFLKHWDRSWMPPTYRGDIIFVSDSQIFEEFSPMLEEFVEYWAEYFKPNAVFFQIGYESDKKWWIKMNNPPKTMGEAIAARVEQACGIFWVDFTLRDVLPTAEK